MTVREKVLKQLYDNGLFEDQAAQVMSRYENSDLGKEMRGRMNDDEADYPPQLMVVVWMGVRRMAVEWIDENCPQHWARPMFAD